MYSTAKWNKFETYVLILIQWQKFRNELDKLQPWSPGSSVHKSEEKKLTEMSSYMCYLLLINQQKCTCIPSSNIFNSFLVNSMLFMLSALFILLLLLPMRSSHFGNLNTFFFIEFYGAANGIHVCMFKKMQMQYVFTPRVLQMSCNDVCIIVFILL